MLLVGGLSLLLICILLMHRGEADLRLAGSELRVALSAGLELVHGEQAELARHPQLRLAALDGEGSEAASRAELMLHERLTSVTALRRVWVLDDQLRPVATEPAVSREPVPSDLTARALDQARGVAQRAMTAGQLQLGWLNLGNGRHWLLLGHPIRLHPHGPPDGAVVSALDIRDWSAPLIASQASQASQMRVELRADAQSLTATAKARGPEQVVAWPILLRSSLRGHSEAFTLQVSQSWWHALAPALWIASAYLVVGAGLVAAVRRQVRQSVQRQVEPLRSLSQAAARVARQGLTEIPTLSVHALLRGGAEVQDLAGSFAEMLERLFLAQNQLELAVAERTQELRQAKQQLDSTLAGLREGVFSISADRLRLHFASPPVAALLGLPPDAAAMCRDCTDALLEPEALAALDAAVEQAVNQGEGLARLRLRRRRDDGSPIWLETRLLARMAGCGADSASDGTLCLDGTLIDISSAMRQREARAAVLAELKLRDRAIDASTNGIVMIDVRLPDRPVVFVNEG